MNKIKKIIKNKLYHLYDSYIYRMMSQMYIKQWKHNCSVTIA